MNQSRKLERFLQSGASTGQYIQPFAIQKYVKPMRTCKQKARDKTGHGHNSTGMTNDRKQFNNRLNRISHYILAMKRCPMEGTGGVIFHKSHPPFGRLHLDQTFPPFQHVSKWTKNDHACAGLVARSK
jgi:hypothetical protein